MSEARTLCYSVVIPAHNEGRVIGRLLSALTDENKPGSIEIVVACNGCTDDTAAVARTFPGVQVLDIATPSKTNALNEADGVATAWPRFYVDADLIVTRETLDELARALDEPGVLAVTARMNVRTEQSSPLVRAYYTVWEALPYAMQDRIAGVIGLSERGRSKFASFPKAVADDLFVQSRFAERERRIVRHVSFDAFAPRTVRDLASVKARVYAGNLLLIRDGHVDASHSRNSLPRSWRGIGRNGRSVPVVLGMPVYLAVSAFAKWRAHRAVRGGGPMRWNRDESTR